MKILSWNIFADMTDLEWRTKEIIKIIKHEHADIICLQEVLYYTFNIIKENLTDEYVSVFKHPYENNTSERIYGESIFVKKNITFNNKSFIVLPSNEGRTASFIDIIIDDTNVLKISTSHLESGISEYKKRRSQLNMIREKLLESSNWLWIGDSNCDEDIEYFDNNDMNPTWFENRFWAGDRKACYDKIMTNIKINNNKCIGDTKIDDKWLSDHNGIVYIIDILNKND